MTIGVSARSALREIPGGEPNMITDLLYATLYVSDQDKALDSYRDKLERCVGQDLVPD